MKLKPINKYNVTPRSRDDKLQSEDDYIVKSLGHFGVMQALICAIASFSRFTIGSNVMIIVFITPHTEFKCVSIKNNTKIDVQNSTCYDGCDKYEYYETLFEDAMVSRFDLICDRSWLASFTQSVIVLGVVVGVTVCGWISDRFGRRMAFRVAIVIATVFSIATAFAPTYWTFTMLRFFSGIGTGGVMALSTIFTIEFAGPRYKDFSGIFPHAADAINLMLLTAIAYYSPTCKILLLSCGLVCIIHLVAVFTLPESPRWLISRHEGDQATKVLTKAAKFNNRDTSHIKEIINKTIENMKRDHKEVEKRTFADLFRTRKLTIITIVSIGLWTSSGICFYGIHQYATLLGSNIYVVLSILAAFQIISTVISVFISKGMKRKHSTVSILTVLGISMLILIFIPDGHWACIALTTIGFTAANAIFCIVYVQANELYPTPLRNMGFSLSSAGAKIGGMLAPYIASTEPHWLASSIFAAIPLLAIVCCLSLPETKGKNLQDTVD